MKDEWISSVSVERTQALVSAERRRYTELEGNGRKKSSSQQNFKSTNVLLSASNSKGKAKTDNVRVCAYVRVRVVSFCLNANGRTMATYANRMLIHFIIFFIRIRESRPCTQKEEMRIYCYSRGWQAIVCVWVGAKIPSISFTQYARARAWRVFPFLSRNFYFSFGFYRFSFSQQNKREKKRKIKKNTNIKRAYIRR